MRIRHRLLLLATLAALVAPAAAAAQIRLTGIVRDDVSEEPIAGARVEIIDYWGLKLVQLSTGADGSFGYELRRRGSYRLRVSRVGFRTTTTPQIPTGTNTYLNVEVRLKSDAVLLAPLAVVGRGAAAHSPVLDGFHARLRAGMGNYFTREDVERIQPLLVSDLAVRVPGVYVASSGTGTERHLYAGRAGGTSGCPMQIWVDGFLLNPRSPGGEFVGMTLDEAVAPDVVEGIEIYRGLASVPAEFLTAAWPACRQSF
jgi:hypothetical protein